MDSRLEKLKEDLESAVEGMSSEQLNWHLPGKWCAAEVLETSVPDLCRNDQRLRESHNKRQTARDQGIHGASRADLRDRGIGPHARRTKSPRYGPAEGLAAGAGAKRDWRKACGHGCDPRAV